jgi:hypothetical protein
MREVLLMPTNRETTHQIAARTKNKPGVGNNIGITDRWSAAEHRFIVVRYERMARTKLYNLDYVRGNLRDRKARIAAMATQAELPTRRLKHVV